MSGITFQEVFGFALGLLAGMGAAVGIMYSVHHVILKTLREVAGEDEL